MILGASVQREVLEYGRALYALRSRHRDGVVNVPKIPLWRPVSPRPLVSLSTFRLSCSAAAASVTEFGEAVEDRAGPELTRRRSVWWKSPYDGQILKLMLPMFLANMIVPITNAVDAAVVGRLGVAQLSGVAVASMISGLFMGSVSFLNVLTVSFVARKHAAKEHKEVSDYISRNFWSALLLGIVMMLLITTQGGALVNFVKPAAEVQPYAVDYLRVLAINCPAMTTFLLSAGALRAVKDAGTVFFATVILACVNAVLDCLFVFGFGWSVSGAALATVISTYMASFVAWRRLIQRGAVQVSDLIRLPDLSGLPAFLIEGSRFSARTILFMGMLVMGSLFMAKRGAIQHATFEVCRQTGLTTYLYYQSLEQAAQILAAGCIGLKDYAAARAIIIRVLQLGFVGTGLIVTALMLFSAQYAGIFTTNALVIQNFVEVTPCLVAAMPISALVTIVDGALIGASKTRLVTTTQGVVYVVCMALLILYHRSNTLNIFNAWIVLRLGTILSGVVTAPYLFSTRTSPYGFKRLP